MTLIWPSCTPASITTGSYTTMTIFELFALPAHDDSVRRALAAALVLCLGSAPLGVLMNLRHLGLVGDALSHAILPGVAVAFMIFGASLWPMTAGALVAGVLIAGFAYMLTRITRLREDTSFTFLYLVALAFGVLVIHHSGGDEELVHMLFGDAFKLESASLMLAAGVSSLTVFCLCVFYRGLVIECFDPDFMQAAGRGRSLMGLLFFALMVINLVASFQILGTLLALGMMLLPAIGAQFWSARVDAAMGIAIVAAMVSAYAGILTAYSYQIPSGPAVVIYLGAFCVISVLIGPRGGLRNYLTVNCGGAK
ncbi:MAG: metal ABC transporter permease [Alphaproteobacteria bacterium]|nr:metal ABC transporter permease [Alphaproteobacteria bacterium]